MKWLGLKYYWFRTPRTYNVLVVSLAFLTVVAILYLLQDVLIAGIRPKKAQATLQAAVQATLPVTLVISCAIALLVAFCAATEFSYRIKKQSIWWKKFDMTSSLVKQAVQRRLDEGGGKVGNGWGSSCSKEMIANVNLNDFHSCAYYTVEDTERLLPVDEFDDTVIGRSRMRALIETILDYDLKRVDQMRLQLHRQHGYSGSDEPSLASIRTSLFAAWAAVTIAHTGSLMVWLGSS